MATDTKPYGDVKYADPKNGKYPIDTEEHIRAAWAYINKAENAAKYPLNGVTLSEVKDRIRAAMKGLGADVSDSGSNGSASRAEYLRTYPLEDMHIIRSADGGDGRTVEAFAAVFDQPAEIQDFQGHYTEIIERSAFDLRLEKLSQMRGGLTNVKVFFNHGRTTDGTPAERFSTPLGVPVEIRAERRGLLTRTRYSDTPLADEVLQLISDGAITAQSFVGPIIRSDPQLRRGGRYDRHGSDLPVVRRTELGLRDYGPVNFPAYTGAEILGVRMSTPGVWTPPPDEDQHDDDDPGISDRRPGTGDPRDEHSARYHQHALYALRSREMREQAGITW